MTKAIRLIELLLINFANLRNKTVNYGEVTALSGKNGEGKTTIGTAPVWILFGKDLLGSDYTSTKNSPRPTTYEYDKVHASVLIEVDGVVYKFAREIDGKKNNFYVNDVPKTATEYSQAVASLIDQDMFMSMYYPAYFFGLHWTKQRALLMQGVPAPINKTVFAEMSRTDDDQAIKDIVLNPQATKLAELVKKHSLDDLEAMHKADKPKLDKAVVAAKSRTKTLQEQLDRLPKLDVDVTALEQQAATLKAEIGKEDKILVDAIKINSGYFSLQMDYDHLQSQVLASKDDWPKLKNEPIDDTCNTCKQPLQDDAVATVTADKDRRMEEYQIKHKELQKQRDEAKALLDGANQVDVSEQQQKVRELEDKLMVIQSQIRDAQDIERLTKEVETAKATEIETLASLRETIFILDAIKAYRAKEAEIQASEIEAKLTRLSVRLFKYVKSSDSYEPDFSIQMDGKDYNALSVGEKIAAGLELTEVLHKQSGLIAPIFIDGIGEYTGEIAAYDQVITGRAVAGQGLKIEVDGVEC